MQEEEVHVACRAHGLEHVEVARREPGQPEQGEPMWIRQELGLVAEPPAGVDQALRRARLTDPGPQQAPQLHLPLSLVRTLCPLRPAPHHFGPVHRVAVEKVGHVPDAREAPRLRNGLGVADVLGQRRQPGLVEVRLDDLEQGPDRPLGQPGVRIRVSPRRQGQGAVHHRPREREVDVGAHTVLPPRRRAEVSRKALRQPALDTPGGHRDNLRCDGIVQWLSHQISQHPHQRVGPLGSMDVQHPGRVRRRCSRTIGPASLQLGGLRPTPCPRSRRPRAGRRWSAA